jgi:hypothetical protein
MTDSQTNVMYYGETLEFLRRYILDSSLDRVCVDPPFKSNRDYNIPAEEQKLFGS